jgi:hypothetical protein
VLCCVLCVLCVVCVVFLYVYVLCLAADADAATATNWSGSVVAPGVAVDVNQRATPLLLWRPATRLTSVGGGGYRTNACAPCNDVDGRDGGVRQSRRSGGGGICVCVMCYCVLPLRRVARDERAQT